MSRATSAQTVSVIVPLYNVERYVRACVESVLTQSYTRWELLLVDDGSTDTTPQLCDELACTDQRIRAFHKPNGGLSDARNYGLDRARGDFILFLDGDDMLSPSALRDLMKGYLGSLAPIVAGESLKVPEDCSFGQACLLSAKGEVRRHEAGFKQRYDAARAIRESLYQRRDHSAWGKLYRRDVWNELRFRKGILYEDLDIFYHVFSEAGRVAYIPATVSFYRQRGTSILGTFNLRRADVLDVTDRLLGWSLTQGRGMVRAAQCRRLSAHCNILGLLLASRDASLPAAEKKRILERCRAVILADGPRCARDPLAPRKIKIAMRMLRVAGFKIFSCMLSLKYRK